MEPNFREPSELGPAFVPEIPMESGEFKAPSQKPREAKRNEQAALEHDRTGETGEVHHEVHESHPLPVEIKTNEKQRAELEKIIARGVDNPNDAVEQLIKMME